MNTLNFTIEIEAPKERVWEVIVNDNTFRVWSSEFHEGSYYEGSWELGEEIRFLAEDDDGVSGMLCKVSENITYQYISLEIIGEIINGEIDTVSPQAKQWESAHENYSLSEEDDITTLMVELEGSEVTDAMKDMYKKSWPGALAKIKELAETL